METALLQTLVIRLNFWDKERDYLLVKDPEASIDRIVCTTTKKIIPPKWAAVRILWCIVQSDSVEDTVLKETIHEVEQTIASTFVEEKE